MSNLYQYDFCVTYFFLLDGKTKYSFRMQSYLQGNRKLVWKTVKSPSTTPHHCGGLSQKKTSYTNLGTGGRHTGCWKIDNRTPWRRMGPSTLHLCLCCCYAFHGQVDGRKPHRHRSSRGVVLIDRSETNFVFIELFL